MKTIFLALLLAPLCLSLPVAQDRDSILDEEDEEIQPIWYQDISGNWRYEDFKEHDDIPEFAQTKGSKDVTIYLYTRANRDKGITLGVEQAVTLKEIKEYDPKRKNFFIVHGWNNDHSSQVNTLIKKALLDVKDVNVFVVDWGSLANSLYFASRKAVPSVAQYLATFIGDLLDTFKLSPKTVELAGHSLGAHVVGIAGSHIAQKYGLVDFIIGLDPAKPLFKYKKREGRIDESDAEYVQIIHTSTSFLGFNKPLGHSDFYPNGGSGQPGCGLIDLGGVCSHGRSYEFYAESIYNPVGFLGKSCDNWVQYQKEKCPDDNYGLLGGHAVDKSAMGEFYLKTNSKSPFAKEIINVK